MAKATSKKWYKSLTNWLNILVTVVAILGVLEGVVPVEYTPYIVAAIGILNVLIRTFKTEVPIERSIK